MQLYTSLVRLKQAMNGGSLPPMTPIAGKALLVIDPALTPGLGALEEDEQRGLRCPVRGCGVWAHHLSNHLRRHPSIGGAKGLRRLLSIPAGAPLISRKHYENLRANLRRSASGGGRWLSREARNANLTRGRATARRNRTGGQHPRSTVGARNLTDRCIAQLTHKILSLSTELGRTPSSREFARKYGWGTQSAAKRTFGSWNSALAQCSLKVRPGHGTIGRDALLEALAVWYAAHGDLPTHRDATDPTRTPYLPQPPVAFRAMKCESWDEAMRRAAAILDIYGGRYGLPERKAS